MSKFRYASLAVVALFLPGLRMCPGPGVPTNAQVCLMWQAQDVYHAGTNNLDGCAYWTKYNGVLYLRIADKHPHDNKAVIASYSYTLGIVHGVSVLCTNRCLVKGETAIPSYIRLTRSL